MEQLPALLKMKLDKTGQTRGASKNEIYQNRVGRNSTVLIPHSQYGNCADPDDGSGSYENGFIVLIDPTWYLTHAQADRKLAAEGLTIGENALIYFQRQEQWEAYRDHRRLPNGKQLEPARSRLSPLGGTYIARVTAATAHGVTVIEGYAESGMRGAGIRVYEYASSTTVAAAKLQLEALVWLCADSIEVVVSAGMSAQGAETRKKFTLAAAAEQGLLDVDRLRLVRAINDANQTICPLCLELVSAAGFMKSSEQVEGRETWNIRITPINLFHIEELRPGDLLHRPYNLGWGHHHCNVVVGDKGIPGTLDWMKRVIENNGGLDRLSETEELIEEAVDG